MKKFLAVLCSFLICSSAQASNRAIAVITDVSVDGSGNHYLEFSIAANNNSYLTGENIQIDMTQGWDQIYGGVRVEMANRLNSTDPTLSITSGDIVMFGSIGSSMVFTNTVSRSIIATAAAANGFQISSSRNAVAAYNVTVSSAVQIGVATNVSGYVVLEIAPTNSSTASDWVEAGARVGTGQNISLAVALASTQTVSGLLMGVVPAGYYARIRSVNSNGTPTYTYNNGREILM